MSNTITLFGLGAFFGTSILYLIFQDINYLALSLSSLLCFGYGIWEDYPRSKNRIGVKK